MGFRSVGNFKNGPLCIGKTFLNHDSLNGCDLVGWFPPWKEIDSWFADHMGIKNEEELKLD